MEGRAGRDLRLRAAVDGRGALLIGRRELEGAAEAEQERDLVRLGGRPGDEPLDDVDVPPRLARAAREIEGGVVRGARARREIEDAQAGRERELRAIERAFVERRELAERRGGVLGGPLRRAGEPRLEGAREQVVAPAGAQRGEELLVLGVALARRLEGGLDVLRLAVGRPLPARDLAEREQDLGPAERGGRREAHAGARRRHRAAPRADEPLALVAGPARDEQQRAVGAVRALELAVLEGEAGEAVERVGVRGVDAQREVELRHRAGAIARGERDAGELVVDERALLGAAGAEVGDDRAQGRGRVVGPAGGGEGAAPREAQREVVRRERDGLVEQRDRGGGRVAAREVEVRGLAEEREPGRRLVGARGVARDERGQGAPRARRAVEVREPLSQRRGLRGAGQRSLQGGAGAIGLAGGEVRVREAERRLVQLLGPCAGAEPLERLGGGRVLAAAREQPGEGVERLDGPDVRGAAVARDRALGLVELVLGEDAAWSQSSAAAPPASADPRAAACSSRSSMSSRCSPPASRSEASLSTDGPCPGLSARFRRSSAIASDARVASARSSAAS